MLLRALRRQAEYLSIKAKQSKNGLFKSIFPQKVCPGIRDYNLFTDCQISSQGGF